MEWNKKILYPNKQGKGRKKILGSLNEIKSLRGKDSWEAQTFWIWNVGKFVLQYIAFNRNKLENRRICQEFFGFILKNKD